MTQEERKLLFKDLCARLSYGVKVYGNYRYSNGDEIVDDKKIKVLDLSALDWFKNGIDIKPYLRPMESMTDDEKKEFNNVLEYQYYSNDSCMCESTDWLNSHHFDYRRLIPMGLALEAPEGIYK